MASRDQENSDSHQDNSASNKKSSSPDARPRKRWKRILLFCAIALIAIILLAPNILGWSGQVGPIANSFADLKGNVEIDSTSLGWFQKIRLSGVKLVGEDGELIADIDKVSSSKSLLNIALNSDDPGEFTIDGAKLDLEFFAGGSNLESAIESNKEPKEPKDSEPKPGSSVTPEMVLHLTNSQIAIREQASPDKHILSNTNARVDILPSTGYINFDVSARSGNSGTLQTSGRIESSFDSGDFMRSMEAGLNLARFDVAVFNPILVRAEQQISVAGELNGKLGVSMSDVSDIELFVEDVVANNVSVHAPEMLSGEPVEVQKLTAAGDLIVSHSRISSENFQIKSEIANLEFEGSADPSELIEAFMGSKEIRDDFKLKGSVDVAVLSKIVPQLVSIREDIRIDEGTVACEAFSRMENGRRRMLVNMELPAMRATMFESRQRGDRMIVNRNRFREINWRNPIRLTASAIQNDSPLWLELLTCESDFLSAQGTTGPDGNGRLRINGDLAQLRNKLQQFFDLSDTRLSGKISGQFDWKKISAEEFEQFKAANKITSNAANMPVFQLVGGCKIDQFLFATAPGRAIREDRLDLKVAVNHAFQNQSSRLETATFNLFSGNDILRASLVRPVRNPGLDSNFMGDFEIGGDIRNWLQRGRAFATIPKMSLKGSLDVKGRCKYSPDSIALQTKSFSAKDFALTTQSMRIREPSIDGKIKLGYHFATQKLIGHHISIQTDSSAVGCENLKVDLGTEDRSAEMLESHCALILDLEEVMTWFQEPGTQCPYRGKLQGEADIAMTGAAVELKLDSEINKFAYLSFDDDEGPVLNEGSPIWSEPTGSLNADVRFNFFNDFLQVKNIVVDAEGLSMNVRGRITDATTVCNLNLNGKLATDSAKLVRRLHENIGIDLQLKGKDESSLSVKGPLFEAPVDPALANGSVPKLARPLPQSSVQPNTSGQPSADEQLNASLQIRWDEGSIYGLPFGKSKVALQYDPSQLDIKPINLPLDAGRLRVDPAVVFQDPMLLTLQPGKLVNRANLSPEICRSWMKYVAPMVAEATQAEGTFSVDLHNVASLPLTNPLNGSLDATIMLHKADVGPGPLGQQMIAIVSNVRSLVKGEPNSNRNGNRVWLQMPQQEINCKIEDGRVFHERMTFQIGDVQIMTTGSVAADQSIDMMVSVPIRPEWLKDRKLLQGLAGDARVVQIPVRGTLAKPSVGTNGLKDWTKNFFRGAAQNLIQKKAAQFLDDSAGKLLKEATGGTGDLLKLQNGPTPIPKPGDGQSLREAAGKLLEDQLRDNFDRLIKPSNK